MCVFMYVFVENKIRREIIFYRRNNGRFIFVIFDCVLFGLDLFLFVKLIKVLSESFRGSFYNLNVIIYFIFNFDLVFWYCRGVFYFCFVRYMGRRWGRGR